MQVTWPIDGMVPRASSNLSSLRLVNRAPFRFVLTRESTRGGLPDAIAGFYFPDEILGTSFSGELFTADSVVGEARAMFGAGSHSFAELLGPVLGPPLRGLPEPR